MGSLVILCFSGIHVTLGKLWQSLFAENLQNWAARTGWSNWSCFSGCWVEVHAFLTLPELTPQPWQLNLSSLLLVLKALPRGCNGIYNWSLRPRTGCAAVATWACWLKSGLGHGGKRLCWISPVDSGMWEPVWFPVSMGAEGSSCSRSVSVVCAAIAMETGIGSTQTMLEQHFQNKPKLVCHSWCSEPKCCRTAWLQGQLQTHESASPD